MRNAYSYSSNYILADQLSRGALCTEGAPAPRAPLFPTPLYEYVAISMHVPITTGYIYS